MRYGETVGTIKKHLMDFKIYFKGPRLELVIDAWIYHIPPTFHYI